jgi:phosphopantothenoylcysteine decarboxylase / phosphopantothenate---cysteine ligase
MSKKLVLVITGSIAAYKALELMRNIIADGMDVHVVCTQTAKQFVTKQSFLSLGALSVRDNLWDSEQEQNFSHLGLAAWADAVIIIPATADFLAKASLGLADDLASTLLLAIADTPVLFAPAMNPRMWHSTTTQEHISRIKARGWHVLTPETGIMACGDEGIGRLPALDLIRDAIRDLLHPHHPLKGKKAFITSGGTRETIDPVRFIGNHASGKQGAALAECLVKAGARVTYIHGFTTDTLPTGVETQYTPTAASMQQAVFDALPCDIAIMTAAVADWQLAEPFHEKQKKNGKHRWLLELIPTPDILAALAMHPMRPKLLIGFAAETGDNWLHHAIKKYNDKGCDWLFANPISQDNPVFGSTNNQGTLIKKGGSPIDYPKQSKKELAKSLVEEIIKHFSNDLEMID